MTLRSLAVGEVMTASDLKRDHPVLFAELAREMTEQGRQEESLRIRAILDLARGFPEYRPLAERFAFTSPGTPEEFAQALLADQAAARRRVHALVRAAQLECDANGV